MASAELNPSKVTKASLANRISPSRWMTIASVAFTAGFWLDPAGAGHYALPLIGGAFAVMFPIVVNRTPVYLGADRSGRVVGYQLAASAVGGTTVPYLVGVLADRRGVGVTAPVSFASVVALTLLTGALLLALALVGCHPPQKGPVQRAKPSTVVLWPGEDGAAAADRQFCDTLAEAARPGGSFTFEFDIALPD